MSVCIAAISDFSGKARLVSIVDRKVSSGESSNEDATIKSSWINTHWCALFVGNDISPCIPISRAVTMEIAPKENTLEIVRSTFEKCYQKYLSNLAASKCLGRWGLTMEKFLETGRKKFGPDNFDRLCHQIEQVKLQCQFLVYGFDGMAQPHLFTVQNPGYAEVKDTPGYWAIGNGAFAAMSMLGFLRQSVVVGLPQTYYNVCAAKFMAENASDVGQYSFMSEISADGFCDRDYNIGNVAREAWDRHGKPTTPKGVLDKIEELINAKQSTSQTSEQGTQ
jgi:hypothetical protein